MFHLNFSHPMEYKGSSNEKYFTQLTIASEVMQEAGMFPARLVSLQHELQMCIKLRWAWGFHLLCAVLALNVGVGAFCFSAEISFMLPFRAF